MAENKEIIEKLVELIEIYLENAQMNEVSTDWQEGDIDFEEVLSIVVHDGLYDLNFTEEQTNEFLALYKALNQEQVDIIEAKLNKETKKGDDIMEKEVKKTVMELNKPVKEGVSKAEADDIVAKLKEAGAEVEVK
jgi:ribosomal protein L7/L12